MSKKRLNALKYKYDFSETEYSWFYSEQSGLCAICLSPERPTRTGKVRALSVDHNHDTGEIRGLLCRNCNVALGMLGDSQTRLQRALDYLRGTLIIEEAEIQASPFPLQIPHGTYGGYTNHECRCAECKAANAEYRREYRSRLKD